MDDRIDTLARRARRLRNRGEFRKAANAYGELTSVQPEAARWWVLLAVTLRAARRSDESAKALRQATYLFRRNGESARLASVLRFIEQSSDLGAQAA